MQKKQKKFALILICLRRALGLGHSFSGELKKQKQQHFNIDTLSLYLLYQNVNIETMSNINMLSDTEITRKISEKLKELRLKQNISRVGLSQLSGVSMSSIVRMEDGEIKSFEAFLRILRTLGKIDVLVPLIDEEEMSPKEYFHILNSKKTKKRKRASKTTKKTKEEEVEW